MPAGFGIDCSNWSISLIDVLNTVGSIDCSTRAQPTQAPPAMKRLAGLDIPVTICSLADKAHMTTRVTGTPTKCTPALGRHRYRI